MPLLDPLDPLLPLEPLLPLDPLLLPIPLPSTLPPQATSTTATTPIATPVTSVFMMAHPGAPVGPLRDRPLFTWSRPQPRSARPCNLRHGRRGGGTRWVAHARWEGERRTELPTLLLLRGRGDGLRRRGGPCRLRRGHRRRRRRAAASGAPPCSAFMISSRALRSAVSASYFSCSSRSQRSTWPSNVSSTPMRSRRPCE